MVLTFILKILTLDHDGGKNAALRHLTQAAAAEQEHVKDSSLLQAIDTSRVRCG